MTPTTAQLDAFRAYCRAGTEKAAAADLGLSYQTVKNAISRLYDRLGVSGKMEAAAALGWLRVPDTDPCGWTCSRPMGHPGPHGGNDGVARRGPERGAWTSSGGPA